MGATAGQMAVRWRRGGSARGNGTLVGTGTISGDPGNIWPAASLGLLRRPVAAPDQFMPAGMQFEFIEAWGDTGNG